MLSRTLDSALSRFFITSLVCITLSSAGYEKRPYYFPIYPQKQNHYYRAGFHHVYGGVATNYNNADRQQYVNAVAVGDGEGIGTAPWYGVPGTGLDFTYGGGYGHGGGGHGGGGHGGGGHGGGGHGGGYGHDGGGYGGYEGGYGH